MSIFNEMADGPDMESEIPHHSSTKTLEGTARNMLMPLYKSAYVNLNDDLLAESERKLVAWREEQREGDLLCYSTSTAVGNAMEGMVMGDNAILKNKVTLTNFKKMLQF
jgi:hypothetical protein